MKMETNNHDAIPPPQGENIGRRRSGKVTADTELDEHGNTDLHRAAISNDVNKIRCILSKDKFPNLEEKLEYMSVKNTVSTYTPLHEAARHNNKEACEALLQLLPEKERYKYMTITNSEYYTALHAARDNCTKTIDVLISYLRPHQLKEYMYRRNVWGNTALHVAAGHNSYESIRSLLKPFDGDTRAKMSYMKATNICGNTALHVAARLGSDGAVTALMTEVPDELKEHYMNLRNHNKDTAIEDAAVAGKQAKVTFYKLWQYEVKPSEVTSLHEWLTKHSDHKHLKTLNFKTRVLLTCLHEPGETRRAIESSILDDLENCVREQSNDLDVTTLKYYRDSSGNSGIHALLTRLSCDDTIYDYVNKLIYATNDSRWYKLLSEVNSRGKSAMDIAKRRPRIETLLRWSLDCHDSYWLPKPPKVLIFYTAKDREGAIFEKDVMEKSLDQFGVESVIKGSFCETDVFQLIREAQEDDPSGLIVVVMSHGTEGAVMCHDGLLLKLKDIILTMCSPQLCGKPKALIVQACQNKSSGSQQVVSTTGQTQVVHSSPSPESPETLKTDIASVIKSGLPNFRIENTCNCGDTDDVNSSDSENGQTIRGPNHQDTAIDFLGLNHRDFAILMSSASLAERNLMVPILASNLRKYDGDIYEVFLKTNYEMRLRNPDQVPLFVSTMQHKFCLGNVLKDGVDMERGEEMKRCLIM